MPSAPNPFYRPVAPSRSPARHTGKPETIDLTDLDDSGSDEWSFEGVSSDRDNVVIAISSDSDSSVEAIALTKDVKARIKKFRKTRPKPDSRPDSEDMPAEHYARKVARKAREFLDAEAAHSGADSGDSDGGGYVSELIDDSPCSSESRAPSPAPRPVGHEIPTSKQRADCVRNQKKIALSTIIPALANPLKRSSDVMLTWYDPKTDEVRSKRHRCQDDIAQESDGIARFAYVVGPQVSFSSKELQKRRKQDAQAKLKKARALQRARAALKQN
jgi:hypothetical protein